ncbi:unnamed protein product [Arabidopsis halleri]
MKREREENDNDDDKTSQSPTSHDLKRTCCREIKAAASKLPLDLKVEILKKLPGKSLVSGMEEERDRRWKMNGQTDERLQRIEDLDRVRGPARTISASSGSSCSSATSCSSGSRGVHINGTIDYGGNPLDNNDATYSSEFMLVSFDVRFERFDHINAPMVVTNDMSYRPTLVNYKGKLGCFCYKNIGVEMWVMEDVEKQEWSKTISCL